MSKNNNNTTTTKSKVSKYILQVGQDNKFIDLMPAWEMQEKCFKNELTGPVEEFNTKTNKTTRVRKSWPYIKPISQLSYEAWCSKVVDPVTGEFYPELNDKGHPVAQKDKGPNARHIIHTIVRYRTIDGEEYLYTLGHLVGFSSLGIRQTCTAYKPEIYQKTIFGHKRKFDQKEQRLITQTDGPLSSITEYLVPFTPENVDAIYSKVNRSKNHNFKVGNHHTRPCNFIVKDEQTDRAVAVEWSDIETTLNLFKNKDFAYLFNGSYIPAPVKAEQREQARIFDLEMAKYAPTIENMNTSSTTATTNNATAGTGTTPDNTGIYS